jgi:hypothetical protein
MERALDSILYIETDIPRGMTATDWRRARVQRPSRRHFIGRFRARRADKSR